MRKIEAPTLADAYEKAAKELSCSITELEYEVIQHPSSGVLGLFKKSAIIVAECKRKETKQASEPATQQPTTFEKIVAEEIIEEVLVNEEKRAFQSEHIHITKKENRASPKSPRKSEPKRVKHELDENLTQQDDVVLDSFFENKSHEEEPKPERKNAPEETKSESKESSDESSPESRSSHKEQRPENNNLELAQQIEAQLTELLSHSCFNIDTIEVDVVDDTALIFIDGDDAALLIGKEGYRYNALSYMIFNWLHAKHDLYIKLEIAQFITTQQEMIKNHIKPVIEYVQINGRGKTRPLDGILVQLALEQLRAEFPNKYVAIKTGRDGRKFVIINEFNNKNHGS